MPNLERHLEIAARIVALRQQLAMAEKEYASLLQPSARPQPSGKGFVPVSQRVLNMLLDAGDGGLSASDIKAIIPNRDAAVDSALQAHRVGGRVVNRDGRWFRAHPERVTRPIRIQADPTA